MRKTIVLLTGLLLAILAACAAQIPITTRGPLDVIPLGVLPIGTPTPAGYRAGLCSVRDFSTTVTPAPGQVCSHWDIYANTAQPNLAVTPSWVAAKTRVAYLATQGLDSAPGIQFFQVNGSGTDVINLPVGVPTVAYTAGSCSEIAPNYGSQIFIDWYDSLVVSYCSWANTNTNITIIPLQLGASAETINVYPESATCGADKQQALEKLVTGEQYKSWVKHALTTWQTYCSNKVFTLATSLGSTYGEGGGGGWRGAKYWLQYLVPPTPTIGNPPNAAIPQPTPILGVMFRHNGLRYGNPNAYNDGTVNQPWGQLHSAAYMDFYNGAAYETFYNRTTINAEPTAERVGNARDMTLSALGPGLADNLFYQFSYNGTCGWDCYIDNWLTDVITKTAGYDASNSSISWVRFRDAEYGRQGGAGYESSDWPGVYTHLATVTTNLQPTRKCWSSVAARATQTAYSTPTICQSTQANVGPESRYTLEYPASATIKVDVADDWVYAGRFNRSFTFSFIYIDSGTDTITFAYKNATCIDATHVITKTNSGAPITVRWTATAALYNNGNTADIEIRTGAGADNIYWLAVETDISTPIPTATVTATTTPTRILVPTQSPTATTVGAATATATNTPTLTPTATGTPVAMSASNAYTFESVTLRADLPDANQAAFEFVWRDTGQAKAVTLLRYTDLAKPSGATVDSATLTLHANGYGTGALPVRLYRIARPWGANTVTWSNTVTETWAIAGAQGVTDRGTTYVAGRLDFNNDVILDVTLDIRAWLDSGVSNYGWGLYAWTDGWLSVAGDSDAIIENRPELNIIYAYTSAVTMTPTPTKTSTPPYTPTMTATVVNTPTLTATPTGTRMPTATPRPGLWINEICADPATDLNLDGGINQNDRVVELFNASNTALDLAGYILTFGISNDLAYTYTFPKYTKIWPNNYKAIYSNQLRNVYGIPFVMPGDTSSSEVRLYAPGARTPLDTRAYSWLGDGLCWALIPSGGLNWVGYQLPTIGRAN